MITNLCVLHLLIEPNHNFVIVFTAPLQYDIKGEKMKETTQIQQVQFYSESIAKPNLKSDVKTYLLNPLFNGLVGFSAFFTLIILTKLFSYIFGLSDEFAITINDIIYSLTGFVMAAGVKFLEFFSKE